MASIPVLSVEAMPDEVMTAVGLVATANLAEHPLDEGGVQRVLQQLT